VTEQNNPPFGQPPQVPAQPRPAPQVPAQPQQPPTAPLSAQQAFGDAPAPPASGEGTFGAAPGAPLPPGEAFGAAPGAPPPAGEAFGAAPASGKKKGIGKIIGAAATVILVIVLVVVGILVKQTRSANTRQAQTGNCIGNLPTVAQGEDKAANDAKVVDCTAAEAAYKVEGRLENKTEAEAKNQDVCAAYDTAEYVYRAIPSGGKGYVLCLSQIKK
jgi:hypothetical protein